MQSSHVRSLARSASIVQSINERGEEHNNKLALVSSVLRRKHVPSSLRTSISDYYKFLWSSSQGDESIMNDLPPVLQLQVDIVATKAMFSRVTLFRFFPMDAILMLVQRLQPVLVLPNEIVLRQGQAGIGLFFIARGLVNVLRDDEVVNRMKGNEYFGERSLLTQEPVSCTVRAATFADLMLFEGEDVQEILAEYPAIVEEIFSFAGQRQKAVQQASAVTARRTSGLSAVAAIASVILKRKVPLLRLEPPVSLGTRSRLTAVCVISLRKAVCS